MFKKIWLHRKPGFKLTVHFQDKPSVLAASRCLWDGDHVVSVVLQPQVRQAHGAIVVGLHPAAVVQRYVRVHPRLPSPYGAAHRSRHKVPLYGGDPAAGDIHWEKHVLLHRPGEAPQGRMYGDGSRLKREEEMWRYSFLDLLWQAFQIQQIHADKDMEADPVQVYVNRYGCSFIKKTIYSFTILPCPFTLSVNV